MGERDRRYKEEELNKLRGKIDDVDEKILKLLNRRAKFVRIRIAVLDARCRQLSRSEQLSVFG